MARNDSLQAGLYKEFQNNSVYTLFPGVVVLPRSDGDPVTVRIHQEYSVRTVNWQASKERTPPVVPAPQPQDDDHDVLIGQTINFPMPRPGQTMPPSYNWVVTGQYQYVERDVHKPSTGFPSPKWPFVFPELQEVAGGLVGGLGSADAVIQALTIPIETGTWQWPFAVLPAAIFDADLSE